MKAGNLKADTGGVLLVLAVVTIITILSSFLVRNFDERIVSHYAGDVSQAFSELQNTTTQYRQDKISDEQLIRAVNNAQTEFKRVAFILNYYYPDSKDGKRKVAPIFRISNNERMASVQVSEDLNYLEELVYNNPRLNLLKLINLPPVFRHLLQK